MFFNTETATKEQVVEQLSRVLNTLRAIVEMEHIPVCSELSSALWHLRYHEPLLTDEPNRYTNAVVRGRTWKAQVRD